MIVDINSKISSSKLTQDNLQDVQVLNPYIHYIQYPGGSGYKINYTDQFTEAVQIFDRYSDFYTGEDQKLSGAFGSPNSNLGDDGKGTAKEPVDDDGSPNEAPTTP